MTNVDSVTVGHRRTSAALSLLSLGLMVPLLLVGIAGNISAALISVVGALLIVSSGWVFVSRRGGQRRIAVLGAVIGLGVFIGGLVAADTQPLPIAAVVVLGAISVALAKHALSLGVQATSAETLGVPSRGPSLRPVLIMNPWSGGGKVARFNLVAECQARGIEPVVLTKGDDLVQLAEDAVARGADVIGMAGGDGSQALVATVAMKHGLPHVVIPAGTRNHLALDLGLDRDDVVGALDAFERGIPKTVDLATVNGRIFVNNASLGLYANIVQSEAYRDAKMHTALDKLPDLLGPNANKLDLRFTDETGELHSTAHVILVSNNPYLLDSLGGMGTRPRMDEGVLGVATLEINSAADARRFLALDALGQLNKFAGWHSWTTQKFQINANGAVEIGVDGEALSMEAPVSFEIKPAAVEILLPPTAPGRSPSARRLSTNAPIELCRIAAGR